jgi:uncharacterized OB-fold protein
VLEKHHHKPSLGDLVGQEPSCVLCGETFLPQARYCSHCGAFRPSHIQETTERNRGAALTQPTFHASPSEEEQVKQKQATLTVLHVSEEKKVIHLVKRWARKRMMVSIGLVFVVLVVGSYTSPSSAVFAWTGFNGSTLRVWLQLLVLPLALGLVPVWFAREKEHLRQRLTQRKLVLIAVAMAFVVLFVVLEVGTYKGGWLWTGFQPDASSGWEGKLWDWLSLLLVPITVIALPIWFSGRQSQGHDETSNPYHQQGVREAERQPQEAA